MGRKPKDQLDYLSQAFEWDDWEGTSDVEELGFVDDSLPDFKPTKLDFREWIEAYSDAIIPGGFVFDEVTNLIIDEAQHCVETRGGRLALALSPRAGKTVIMQLLVSWVMAHYNMPVLWVSASGKLSEMNAKAVMNILAMAGYKLHPKSSSVQEFSLAYKAAAATASLSLGTSTLGRSAGLLVCDDLVGKREWIFQEAYQAKLKSSWENDLLSRLTRCGDIGQSVICVAQRLGTQDHLAMIIEKSDAAAKAGYEDNWRVVEVPYIHPDEGQELDYLNRYPDHWTVRTVPCNGRHGLPTSSRVQVEEVMEKKVAMDPAAFAAMYLCSVDEDGGDGWSASWIKPVKSSEITPWVTAVCLDPALIGGKGRDGHGLAVLALGHPDSKYHNRVIILEAQSLYVPVFELYDHFKAACTKYKATYGIIEATASGPELIRNARESDLGFFGVNIVPVRPKMNKTARLAAATGIFAAHRVVYPEMSPWIHGLNAQFRSIALGTSTHKKDDTADAVLMGVEYLSNLARSGMQLTPAHWSRGANFREANAGSAVWGRGTGPAGQLGSRFETDANQPWQGRAAWD